MGFTRPHHDKSFSAGTSTPDMLSSTPAHSGSVPTATSSAPTTAALPESVAVPSPRRPVDSGYHHEDDDTRALWDRHLQAPTIETRNDLVLRYAPLVKYVAGRVATGLPATHDLGDLISEGMFGLIDCIERFDAARGHAFQAFAAPRIRGAIIDSLRSNHWVPRTVQNRLRDIEEATARTEAELGRAATEAEVAAAVGLEVADVRKAKTKPRIISGVTDDEVEEHLASLGFGEGDTDTRLVLLDALRGLPERDRIIVVLYFYEGFTLAEIGRVLEIGESRVCQLRTRALAALKVLLLDADAA